jgi:hypothetical protein
MYKSWICIENLIIIEYCIENLEIIDSCNSLYMFVYR